MADKEEKPVGEEDDETDLNYTPPAQKSLQEIQELDKDDESLRKYKQTLLGAGPVVAGQCVTVVSVLLWSVCYCGQCVTDHCNTLTTVTH